MFRYGDCESCDARPCRSAPSNTGSPVVFVNSARTMESFSVSFGPRCAKKKYAPATIRTATTETPITTQRRAIAAGPLASGTVVAEAFPTGTFAAELDAAETLPAEMLAAEPAPLSGVITTAAGTP